MIFTDVRLQNYRSYSDASFELGADVTIAVGPNGAGKSNLIEALLLVANSTAYRDKTGLINHKKDWARVDVHTDKNLSRSLKITRQANSEKPSLKFLINEKTYKRLPYQQKQPAVLFEPNNLLLMHGEPQARREYIDGLSAGLAEGYSSVLLKYKRALSQRNALLKKEKMDKSQLFVWNVRVAELAEIIVRQRLHTLGSINQRLSGTYSKISNKKSGLEIAYKTQLNEKNYSAGLLKKFDSDLAVDRARGFTGSGPHREDFSIDLNKDKVATTASRGEVRTLLLALKIIELELLENKTKNRPLLLLDDVFSELDGSRRKALTKFLRKYQTVITTTDADIVLKNFSQNCQIIPLG